MADCYFSPLHFLSTGDFLTSSQLSATLSPQQPPDMIHCVNFSTAEDAILEEDEVFDFTVTTTDPAVLAILPGNGQITILDNDRKLQSELVSRVHCQSP